MHLSDMDREEIIIKITHNAKVQKVQNYTIEKLHKLDKIQKSANTWGENPLRHTYVTLEHIR